MRSTSTATWVRARRIQAGQRRRDDEVHHPANIACGFHAGDRCDGSHGEAVKAGCRWLSPRAQAGFGRRVMDLSPDEVEKYMLYQLGASGLSLEPTDWRCATKPGALSNVTFVNLEMARATARAVANFSKEIIFVALANTPLVQAGQEMGLKVALEAYPERAYNADGTLRSRKLPGASIHDPEVAVARAVQMVKEGTITAYEGDLVEIQVDTLCIHGDNPVAPKIAAAMVEALKAADIQLKPMAEFL